MKCSKAIELASGAVFDTDAPMASTHWWGDPDMDVQAEGFDWPCTDDGMDLIFLGQVRLEDLPRGGELPPSGLLLFFADVDYSLGNMEADSPGIGLWPADACRVIYYPAEKLEGLQRVMFLDDGEVCTPRAREVLINEGGAMGDGVRLLGEPRCFEWDDWPEPCAGWRLLLQVDSEAAEDYQLRFYDDGLLYFIISEEDLRAGRFDRVRAFMYSS